MCGHFMYLCLTQPGIALEVKEKLWTAAVRAAQAVGYVGAGEGRCGEVC